MLFPIGCRFTGRVACCPLLKIRLVRFDEREHRPPVAHCISTDRNVQFARDRKSMPELLFSWRPQVRIKALAQARGKARGQTLRHGERATRERSAIQLKAPRGQQTVFQRDVNPVGAVDYQLYGHGPHPSDGLMQSDTT